MSANAFDEQADSPLMLRHKSTLSSTLPNYRLVSKINVFIVLSQNFVISYEALVTRQVLAPGSGMLL